jgi:hypothetical protein
MHGEHNVKLTLNYEILKFSPHKITAIQIQSLPYDWLRRNFASPAQYSTAYLGTNAAAQ